jgi:hypothetical protein
VIAYGNCTLYKMGTSNSKPKTNSDRTYVSGWLAAHFYRWFLYKNVNVTPNSPVLIMKSHYMFESAEKATEDGNLWMCKHISENDMIGYELRVDYDDSYLF